MSPEEGLLRAICAEPDDDGLRLIYADWLEERGAPTDLARSALIRVQVALASMAEDDPQRPEYESRARNLLAAHEESWVAPFRRFQPEAWLFRRGFLEDMTLPDEVFLREAQNLFESTPLSSVRLLPAQGSIYDLANFPLLARLRGLDLAGWHLGGDGLLVLLSSPHLPRLRSLGLAENSLVVREAGMVEYEPPPQLAELSALDLSSNTVDDEGMETLARMPALASLASLSVRQRPDTAYYDRIHASGAAALADSPYLTRLADLDLADNAIGDAGLRSLVGSSHLAHLRRLDVSHNGIGEIGEAGLEALASSPYLSGLSVLKLAHNSIDDRGGHALAAAAHLSRRVRLDLRGNRLGADCRAALRARYDNPVLLDEA